jgi:hypothetical protein
MDFQDQGQIVHIKIEAQWILANAQAFNPKLDAHCASAPYPVQLIVDLTQTDIFPDRLLQIRKSATFTNPNIHIIAYVGNMRQRIFSETINKLAHSSRNRYFASVDEALAYLREAIEAGLDQPGDRLKWPRPTLQFLIPLILFVFSTPSSGASFNLGSISDRHQWSCSSD